MLTKIKDMFKKNEKTYFYANLIRFSRNEEFRDCVRSFNSCDVIHIQHPGELFPQSIYYCIKNHGSGFWSEVLLTMQYLQFAELFKLVPVICWDKSGIYVEDFPINGTKNGFEYYFEPVSEIEYQKVYDCRNVIYSTIRHRFPDGKQLEYPDYFSRIERYGTLYKTFFHLNAVTKKYIRNNIDNIFMNSRGGVLGVHIRGTDYKKAYVNHPVCLNLEDYEEPIHLLLKKYNFKKIFLATDSLEALDFMKKKFGKLLVYYEDVQRSSGEVGNFEVASTRKNHHYLLGLEVLRDAYTLANCDALISGLSAVSLAAHYIKIADGAKYDEAIIIDHGINRVGDKNR